MRKLTAWQTGEIKIFLCLFLLAGLVYPAFLFYQYIEPDYSPETVVSFGGYAEKPDLNRVYPVTVEFQSPIPECSDRKITSNFGWRVGPFSGRLEDHKGLDMIGVWRGPIYACADGLVFKVTKNHPIYGKCIWIVHADGSWSLYGHLNEVFVSTGDRVIASSRPIGIMGGTGMSVGEHLHLEIFKNGVWKNPVVMLNLHPADNGRF